MWGLLGWRLMISLERIAWVWCLVSCRLVVVVTENLAMLLRYTCARRSNVLFMCGSVLCLLGIRNRLLTRLLVFIVRTMKWRLRWR